MPRNMGFLIGTKADFQLIEADRQPEPKIAATVEVVPRFLG
jgi:hypothetical protein